MRENAAVSHANPRAELMVALAVGREEFMVRRYTRFHRRDIQLFVRAEQRLLNAFGKSGFRNASLNDISVSGASFVPVAPIHGKWVSLRVRFSDEAEFLLTGRLMKRREGGAIQRVQFLQHDQAFTDHLLRSSLDLRFRDGECFGAVIEHPV
ncbi:MAG TPA: hypothetical protein VI457_16425 [Methylococcaceae bacterium]|nr:hypothetical protein [Methylococcaceae bacterium]